MRRFFDEWRFRASYEPLVNPFAWLALIVLVMATWMVGLGPAPLLHFLGVE